MALLGDFMTYQSFISSRELTNYYSDMMVVYFLLVEQGQTK